MKKYNCRISVSCYAIIIIFLIVSVSNVSLVNGQINVEKANTNILYVGGTGSGNYTKIQDAIDDVSADSRTIYIFPDIYREHLIINKSLNLIGKNSDNTIIRGGIYIKSITNIFINNLTIDGGSGEVGIDLRGTYNVNISNCIIKNNWVGIRTGTPYDGQNPAQRTDIFNNEIENNGYGIWLLSSSNNRIKNNLILKNREGINIEGGLSGTPSNNEICYNAIIDNKEYGIWLGYKVYNNSVKIYNNSFAGNKVHAYDRDSIEWSYNNYGNYWDHYDEIDSDNDRIGDVPYSIDNDSKDSYPLIDPPTERYRSIFMVEMITFIAIIITVFGLILIGVIKRRRERKADTH